MRRKILSWVMVMVLAIAMLAIDLPRDVETVEAAGLSISDLRNKFPDGKYWNHVTHSGHGYDAAYNDACNNPDGYTEHPCATHNGNASVGQCDCNSWDGAIQCVGFALKCASDVYGGSARTWEENTSTSGIKPGDILSYIDAGIYDKKNGHTVFVIGVSGDTISVAECNDANAYCRIRWDRTVNLSSITKVIKHRIAPYEAPQGGTRVNSPTQGYIDTAIYNGNGTIYVDGWAYDHQLGDGYAKVKIYLDGVVKAEEVWAGAVYDKNNGVAELFGSSTHKYAWDISTGEIAAGTHVVTVSIVDSETGAEVPCNSVEGKSITINIPGPAISNVQFTEQSANGFTLKCDFQDSTGINKVDYSAWLQKNGKGTAIYANATLSDAGSTNVTAFCKVETKDFNYEAGTYCIALTAYSGCGINAGFGTYTITVEARPGGDEFYVNSVSLNEANLALRIDESATLFATVDAVGVDDGVIWTSSDENVAAVENGKVTAKAAGTATITATSVADSTKTASCLVTVSSEIDSDDSDTEKTGIWIGGLASQYTDTGSEIKPAIHVYYNSKRLMGGKDYTLAVKNNTNAGKATLTVNLKGSYSGKYTTSFMIAPAELSAATIETVSTIEKKSVQKIVPTLTYKGKTLKKGKDFTVSFPASGDSAYQAAGTYEIALSGKGNFTGEAATQELIREKGELIALSSAKIELSAGQKTYTYDPTKPGQEFTNSYTLSYTPKGGSAIALREGEDYTVRYDNNINPGTATTTFLATSNGRCYGTKKATFKIAKAQINLKTNSAISIAFPDGNSVPFSKGGAKPTIEVLNGTTVLTEGEDYTVSYSGNKTYGKGTPTVTVKGKGNYKGSKTATFTMTKRDIGELNLLVNDFVYSKKANAYRKTKITVLDLDGAILAKSDYTIGASDWSAESSTPTAGSMMTVTLHGAGGYTGSVTGTFRVLSAEQSIGKAKVTFRSGFTYDGQAVEPTKDDIASVKLGSETLSDADYEIVGYQNNTKAGTAKLIIRGKGSYGGLATVNFKIAKRVWK